MSRLFLRGGKCVADLTENSCEPGADFRDNQHDRNRNKARNNSIFNCGSTFFIAQKTSNRTKHDLPLKES